jgi:hypothetical protein
MTTHPVTPREGVVLFDENDKIIGGTLGPVRPAIQWDRPELGDRPEYPEEFIDPEAWRTITIESAVWHSREAAAVFLSAFNSFLDQLPFGLRELDVEDKFPFDRIFEQMDNLRDELEEKRSPLCPCCIEEVREEAGRARAEADRLQAQADRAERALRRKQLQEAHLQSAMLAGRHKTVWDLMKAEGLRPTEPAVLQFLRARAVSGPPADSNIPI